MNKEQNEDRIINNIAKLKDLKAQLDMESIADMYHEKLMKEIEKENNRDFAIFLILIILIGFLASLKG